MRLEPIRSYRTPNYPRKGEVIDNPKLLMEIPKRWQGNRIVGAALSSLLIISLTACSNKADKNANLETVRSIPPLFIHGEGRGSYGCVSVVPSYFLSEEEAFDVIQEVMKREKISFTKDKVYDDIDMPITNIYAFSPEEREKHQGQQNTVKGRLYLDGYDEEKKIGFEFVSRKDIVDWHKEIGYGSSVENYEFLSAAQILRDSISQGVDDAAIAVFYEPFARLPEHIYNVANPDWDKIHNMLKEEAIKTLQLQVKDFIEWLEAEGII